MADPLLTIDEATEAWPGFGDLSATRQASLIDGAAGLLENICGRTFGLDAYTEVYRPVRSRIVRTKSYPIVSLDRLACDWSEVCQISNAGSTASRATVTVTDTGLTFAATVSGVTTTAVLAFASYPTVGSLGTAIGSLGNGWAATVTGTWSTWATADLFIERGTFGALPRYHSLWAYTRDLSEYIPDFENGTIELRESFALGYRFPDRKWAGDPRRGGVLVQYHGGYATANVPGEIKEACRIAVKAMAERSRSTGIYKSEALGARSWTLADLPQGVGGLVRDLVGNFIRWESV